MVDNFHVLSQVNPATVFFEWAALIPLVVYLASPRDAHTIVGRAALAGRIEVGLLPKLGSLESVARLLREGFDFLDHAASVGDCRREVWDANWGSVFPCANGAASQMVNAFAMRRVVPVLMPKRIGNVPSDGSPASAPPASSNFSQEWDSPKNNNHSKAQQQDRLRPTTAALTSPKEPRKERDSKRALQSRRYQKLCVVQFTKAPYIQEAKLLALLGTVAETLLILALLVLATLAGLYGLYGTAASISVAILMRLCVRLIRVERSPDYLKDNEHGRMQACMLSAIHQNASTWYLHIGSRGIVDALLNKSLIYSVSSVFGDSRGMALLSFFIRGLSLVQLGSTTYVAAQKGWDSVAFLAFIVFAWVFEWITCHPHLLALRWMHKSGVRTTARTFVFDGRTVLLGGIQVLKANPVTAWWDQIIVPCPRRDALLHALNEDERYQGVFEELSEVDQQWVEEMAVLSRVAAKQMQAEFAGV